MAFFRSGIAGLLAAALAAVPVAAAAHSHHGHQFDSSPAPAMARSHAVVSGVVTGVDYGSASIIVNTPRGRVAVAVTPSTSIFRGSDFASFADLSQGARVDIDVSDVGGRLVAQIIRIH